MTTESSAIFNKLRQRTGKAWDQKKKVDEPKARSQDLPNNLRGVAQVSSAKLAEEDNEDKTPYVSFTGIILTPASVRGRRATIRYRFKDTEKKTATDVLDQMFNDVSLMGINTEQYGDSDAECRRMLADLVASKACFAYRTWMGKATAKYPNPRVNIDFEDAATAPEGSELEPDTVLEADPEEAPLNEAPPTSTTRRQRGASSPQEAPVEADPFADAADPFAGDDVLKVGDISGFDVGKGVIKDVEILLIHPGDEFVDVKLLATGQVAKKQPVSRLREPTT